jgi:hypothetical protein
MHLHLHGNQAQVPGFYDPLPGGEKTLNIRYTFGGRPHFVEVVDGAPVTLPQSGLYCSRGLGWESPRLLQLHPLDHLMEL